MAATTFTQFRAWIGPRWRDAGAASADIWLQIASGNISLQEAATTITATLAAGATSTTLAAGAAYPLTGGWIFIGPNGSGQSWEYVDYSSRSTNTITGLTREPTEAGHNRTHTAGAVARLFWPLQTNNGKLTISRKIDENLAAAEWTATLAGIRIPPVAVRNHHLIAIDYRTSTAAAWTPLLIGWINNPKYKDDYRRRGEWSIEILSSAGIVAKTVAHGIRAGAVDVARNGSATSDTTLANANKERHSGDYSAAAPDFSASSTIDGDPNSLWITETIAGNGQYTTPSYIATIVRIMRYPGETDRSRYIEFSLHGGKHLNKLIHNKTGAGAMVYFNGLTCEEGDCAIICEDRITFERNNPLAKPKGIFEIGSAFFDALDPASDCVALFEGNWEAWSNNLTWGDPNNRAYHDGTSPEHEYSNVCPATPTMGSLAAAGPGAVLWYYNQTDPGWADHYKISYEDPAGYTIGDAPDPWVKITLPALGLIIGADMSSTSPAAGETLTITEESGGASTAGLATSGTIQIGSEQISYNNRTAGKITITQRGAYSTTAAAHVAGDRVFVRDVDGTASDGQPVNSIGWRRRAGGMYPQAFRLRTSNKEQARTPNETNLDEDWTTLYETSSYTATDYTLTISPTRRVKHILIGIDHLNVDQQRPRLNTIFAYIDPAYYDTSTWLQAGVTAGAIIKQVLTNAGLPATAIGHSGTITLEGFSTARDAAWTVAADLADMTGSKIGIELTSAIIIGANSTWTNTSLTPARTWTRTDARAVEMIERYAREVSQVEIDWRTPDEADNGIARYPADPVGAAPPLKIGPQYYASAAAADNAARRQYIKARYKTQIAIECAQGDPTITPGEIHAITWQFADDTQPTTRTIAIVAVDHQIDANRWTTVITGIQLDRDWYA